MSGPGAISRLAWRWYRGAPLFVRVLMTLRPYICPLEVVAEVVTLVDVLHHVPPGEQRAFIGRIGQTSARTAVVKDVDTRPRRKAWANALHDFLMTRRRVYPRAMAEVALWLREDGFTVTRSERVDRLCYAHYLIVAER